MQPKRYYDFNWLLECDIPLTHEDIKSFLMSLNEDYMRKMLAELAVDAFTIFADKKYAKDGASAIQFNSEDKVIKETINVLLRQHPSVSDLMKHITRKMDAQPKCGLIYSQLLDFEALLYKRRKSRLTPSR